MNLPAWNLSEFYSSFKDKQINKDLQSLKKKINLFSIQYKGNLGKLKNQQLVRTLIEFEKIEEIILKLRKGQTINSHSKSIDLESLKMSPNLQILIQTYLIHNTYNFYSFSWN